MRRTSTQALALGLCLQLFVPAFGTAESQSQPSLPSPTSPERTLKVAREVISAARFATFVTRGASGEAQARIVDPLPPGDSLDVYVATNPLSRKVREIRKDPRVTLLYFDASRPAYVTLVGRATEVEGAEKATHHKKEWQAFFPVEKPETYALYRVVVSRVEVVSAPDGLPGDPTTWRPEIVTLK